MPTSFEDRIVAERQKMRGSVDALKARVHDNARGPRSIEILEKTLKYESTGHLGLLIGQPRGTPAVPKETAGDQQQRSEAEEQSALALQVRLAH